MLINICSYSSKEMYLHQGRTCSVGWHRPDVGLCPISLVTDEVVTWKPIIRHQILTFVVTKIDLCNLWR